MNADEPFWSDETDEQSETDEQTTDDTPTPYHRDMVSPQRQWLFKPIEFLRETEPEPRTHIDRTRSYDQLTDTRKEAVDLIAKNPRKTIRELGEMTELSTKTVERVHRFHKDIIKQRAIDLELIERTTDDVHRAYEKYLNDHDGSDAADDEGVSIDVDSSDNDMSGEFGPSGHDHMREFDPHGGVGTTSGERPEITITQVNKHDLIRSVTIAKLALMVQTKTRSMLKKVLEVLS